jgi:tetratricopeptide (TPR) repeat protein
MSAELPDFDAQWNYDDLAQSEQRFRALLPLAEAHGETVYQAELLTQLARAEGLQHKFEAAHVTLDAVHSLLSESTQRVRVRYLLERGRVFNSSGKPESAEPLFTEAWGLARAYQEDELAVDAAHMLAIVARPDQQQDWNLRALDLAERSDQPGARKWFGSLYNNIGWAYHDAGKYTEALELFQKALRVREQAGERAQIRIARWCVARALRSLGRIEEALAIQRWLLEELNTTGETDGYVYEELAECLLALGKADEACPQFALAYAALSQDSWLAEGEPARLERLRKLMVAM